MCLLYVYVIRQGPNQYPSYALTWTRTSLVQCTPRGLITLFVSCNNIRFCSEGKYYEPFDQIKCGTLTPKDLRQPCYPRPQHPMNLANKINSATPSLQPLI
jgi:hypothetical protein